MLIQNMMILSHESSVLMMKIGIYRQKSSFFDQSFEKVIFLNREKKRKEKAMRNFVTGGMKI
jgi:hypothetical protein